MFETQTVQHFVVKERTSGLSLKWLITICIIYSGKEAPTKLVCSLIFSRGRLMRASSVPHPWS
jgi:hypothetical protein